MKRIIWILSYIYPLGLENIVKRAIRNIKSAKEKRRLKKCGKNFYIRYPINSIKGEKYLEIGDNFNAGSGLILTAWDKYGMQKFQPKITIGDNVLLGENAQITSINEIKIGNNLLTGKNIFITDHSHGKISYEEKDIPPISRELYSKGKVKLGNNIWLGNNVCILSGVELGDNVTVGANSVVTKSFPANCVIGGIPAKIIKRINGDQNEPK